MRANRCAYVARSMNAFSSPVSSPSELLVVSGMLKTKDASGFFRPLAPHVAAARTVTIPGEEASLTAEETAAAAARAGLTAIPAASVDTAVVELARSLDRPARILICGSLYLAGKVLAENS